MHQAAARYWNQVAESQRLATPWAKQMFPLPQSELDAALAAEEARLTRETNDPVVASAYLKVMPLLWERTALSNFLLANPSMRIAMPPVESVPEAIQMARKDFRLTTGQMTTLSRMLKKMPT
jgi:hypothetical protein